MKPRWPQPDFEPNVKWALKEPIDHKSAETGLAERHQKLHWLAEQLGIDMDTDPHGGYLLAFLLACAFVPGFQSAAASSKAGRPHSAGLSGISDRDLAAWADAVKAVRPATIGQIAQAFALAGDPSLKRTQELRAATKTVQNRIARGRSSRQRRKTQTENPET